MPQRIWLLFYTVPPPRNGEQERTAPGRAFFKNFGPRASVRTMALQEDSLPPCWFGPIEIMRQRQVRKAMVQCLVLLSL